MVKLKKGLFYTVSVWDHNGDLNYIPIFLHFVMKIPKNSNPTGLEISAFLEIFLLEDLVVLKGPNFWWSHGPKFVCENSCYVLSPQIHLASWMSLGMMVTHPEWMAHKLLSSSNPTR